MSGLKQTFLTRLGDVDTSAKEVLGVLRYEGNKVYKYVKVQNAGGTVTGAAGDLVGYAAAGGYTNNQVVIKAGDADAVPITAGVLQGTYAGVAGTPEYGWIQIRGAATLTVAVTSGAIGSGFRLSTTDKTGTVTVATDVNGVAGLCVSATTAVALFCLE